MNYCIIIRVVNINQFMSFKNQSNSPLFRNYDNCLALGVLWIQLYAGHVMLSPKMLQTELPVDIICTDIFDILETSG